MTGQFANGLRHGEGVQLHASGQWYTGQWKFDERHGEGTHKDNRGVYSGLWMDGKRVHGTHESAVDGEKKVYDGQWANGQAHGVGTLTVGDKQQQGHWCRGEDVDDMLAMLGTRLLDMGIDNDEEPSTPPPAYATPLHAALTPPPSPPTPTSCGSPSPRVDDSVLTGIGRRAAMCLLSHVIANVPVSRCSIVTSVQHAADSGKHFTAGELVLLAYIKVPCAIDFVAKELPRLPQKRTRTAWRGVIDKAVAHFRATCSGKDMDKMHPTYRQHKNASALSRETTSGLVWMQKHLGTYRISDFLSIVAWQPKWNVDTLEDMAASLTKHPFRLGGSLYKRVHSIRSVVTALGYIDDEYARAWLQMSSSNDDALAWMYPDHVDTPSKAIEWIHGQCLLVSNELSEQEAHREVLDALKSMTRGDEACFRCEYKKVHDQLSDDHIDAMETAIAENIGSEWRHRRWGKGGAIKETPTSGAFINGLAAADVLVQDMKKRASKTRVKDRAYAPPTRLDLPSVEDQMEFVFNRTPSRDAAVKCMGRLGCT